MGGRRALAPLCLCTEVGRSAVDAKKHPKAPAWRTRRKQHTAGDARHRCENAALAAFGTGACDRGVLTHPLRSSASCWCLPNSSWPIQGVREGTQKGSCRRAVLCGDSWTQEELRMAVCTQVRVRWRDVTRVDVAVGRCRPARHQR